MQNHKENKRKKWEARQNWINCDRRLGIDVDTYDIMIFLDKTIFKDELGITSAQLSDFKDVFLLFDKDQDGVLSFLELTYAVKVLGIIITGKSKILRIMH